MNKLPFTVNGLGISLEKPIWWDDYQLPESLKVIDGNSAILSAMGITQNPKKKEILFATYHYYCFEDRGIVPYSLIWNAEKQGEHQWIIAFYEGLLESMETNPIENVISNHEIYFKIGEAYYELNQIEKAKENFKIFLKISEEKSTRSNKGYYYKQCKNKMQELESITDLKSFLEKKNDFRNTLNQFQLKMEDENFKEKIIAEVSFLTEHPFLHDVKTLSNLEVALLYFVFHDYLDGDGKIFTSEMTRLFKERIEEHHGKKFKYVDLVPMSFEFPTESSNKWVIHSPGREYEIGHFFFDGWEFKKLNLSH